MTFVPFDDGPSVTKRESRPALAKQPNFKRVNDSRFTFLKTGQTLLKFRPHEVRLKIPPEARKKPWRVILCNIIKVQAKSSTSPLAVSEGEHRKVSKKYAVGGQKLTDSSNL